MNFLCGEGDADGDHRLARPQGGNRHIVIARAIADAVAAPVKSRKRRNHNVWEDLGRVGAGFADAPLPADERAAEFPSAHDQRASSPVDRGQRHPCPRIGEAPQQGNGLNSLRIGA